MLHMHHSFCTRHSSCSALFSFCFRSVLLVGCNGHIVLIFLSGQSDHSFDSYFAIDDFFSLLYNLEKRTTANTFSHHEKLEKIEGYVKC